MSSRCVFRNYNGFTLVEMLVAMSLLSIIIVAVNGYFLTSVISWHNSQDKAEVEENLRIGINYLTRELRQAENIVSFDLLSGGKVKFIDANKKTISYFCSISGDTEHAYQLIRAVNGVGNNPVARYINEISVKPDDCDEHTRLISVTMVGEKGKSGEMNVSTTIMLRKNN